MEPNGPDMTIDEETKGILSQALDRADEDDKTAIPAREFMAGLRERLLKREPATR